MKPEYVYQKTFNVAGVSRRADKNNNAWKLRFGKGPGRIRSLLRGGHKCDIIELPFAMNKQQIVEYLQRIDFAGNDPEVRAVLDRAHKKYCKTTQPVEQQNEPATVD